MIVGSVSHYRVTERLGGGMDTRLRRAGALEFSLERIDAMEYVARAPSIPAPVS